MEFPSFRQGRRRAPVAIAVTGAVWLLTVSGCRTMDWIAPQPPPCQISPAITKAELIDHLNRNIAGLNAWQTTDVTIQARGVPVRLSAVLAVESPRNFRLIAKSIRGNEADFGSNTDRFWFWMRDSQPKHVFTVRHDQWVASAGQIPIPFQPDWLMEVLGVIPIDETDMTLQRNPDDSETVSLTSEQQSPSGQPVRRVIRVETCYGRIVSHELYDSAGTLIARAELDDFQTDPASGISLPHRIHLQWPQGQLDMTLHVGPIEVNPARMPDRMWRMPKYAGYPPLNLARRAGLRQPGSARRRPRFERP